MIHISSPITYCMQNCHNIKVHHQTQFYKHNHLYTLIQLYKDICTMTFEATLYSMYYGELISVINVVTNRIWEACIVT